MKIYITYKFSGEEPDSIKNKLLQIDEILKNKGYETFIYFRDIQNWHTDNADAKQIMSNAFSEMKKSDAVLCFVDNQHHSEGMLLEAGYAKALNKKLIVAVKQGAKSFLLKGIADHLFEFKDFDDFSEKFPKL